MPTSYSATTYHRGLCGFRETRGKDMKENRHQAKGALLSGWPLGFLIRQMGHPHLLQEPVEVCDANIPTPGLS